MEKEIEKSLIDILDQELQWCEKNKHFGKPQYEEGFVAGVRQAKRMIETYFLVRLHL